MKKAAILGGLLLFTASLSLHSQTPPALDDLGTALVNHGMDPGTAGPTAAIIEVAISNNNALMTRLTNDETQITGLLAQGNTQNNNIATLMTSLATAQGTITNDEQTITSLQNELVTLQGAQSTNQGAETTDALNISQLQTTISTLQTQLAQLQTTAPESQVSILQQPVNLTASAGTPVTFNMKVSSGGCRSQITTTLAGGTPTTVFGSQGDESGNWSYKISSTTSAMNQETLKFNLFGCTSQAGQVTSNTVTLTVQ